MNANDRVIHAICRRRRVAARNARLARQRRVEKRTQSRVCCFCWGPMTPAMMYWPRGQDVNNPNIVPTAVWMMKCCFCGASGPTGNSPDEAQSLWNSGTYPHVAAWDRRFAMQEAS